MGSTGIFGDLLHLKICQFSFCYPFSPDMYNNDWRIWCKEYSNTIRPLHPIGPYQRAHSHTAVIFILCISVFLYLCFSVFLNSFAVIPGTTLHPEGSIIKLAYTHTTWKISVWIYVDRNLKFPITLREMQSYISFVGKLFLLSSETHKHWQ